MDDEEALLKAVCEHPDADTPRLVYADWLDEHADAVPDRDPGEMRDQARFIRVQVGLARGSDPGDSDRARPGEPISETRRGELEKEANDLLGRHQEQWDRPLRKLGAFIEYRRGFPYHFSMGAEQFLENAEHIFAAAPMQSATITELERDRVETFAECPHLGNLTRLCLWQNNLGSGDVGVLAGSPNLRNLAHLDLGDNGIGDAGAQALGESPHLANLTRLDLSDNNIGDAGAQALADSPHLRNLRSLYLPENDIGVDGAQALAGSSDLGRLTHLDLSYNHIGREGAQALADSPHLRNLRSLYLPENDIGPEGAMALFNSRFLTPKVKTIALGSAGFGQLAQQVREAAAPGPDRPGPGG